jgi:hypothetical protein
LESINKEYFLGKLLLFGRTLFLWLILSLQLVFVVVLDWKLKYWLASHSPSMPKGQDSIPNICTIKNGFILILKTYICYGIDLKNASFWKSTFRFGIFFKFLNKTVKQSNEFVRWRSDAPSRCYVNRISKIIMLIRTEHLGIENLFWQKKNVCQLLLLLPLILTPSSDIIHLLLQIKVKKSIIPRFR